MRLVMRRHDARHQRAFDRGIMWIDDGFVIRFSKRMRACATKNDPSPWNWTKLGDRLGTAASIDQNLVRATVFRVNVQR